MISVVTPCYNEEENVEEVYAQVKAVFSDLPQYRYEHIFIDNASTDSTVAVLKKLAAVDYNVKIIVNIKNFGWIRSPHYGLLQAHGDAVVLIVADLQDPPALIKEFLQKWEEGKAIVVGIKNKSEENGLIFAIRKVYYNLIKKLSDIEQIKNFTGFGLYDQKFIAVLRTLKDPYPYFRGLITEVGFDRAEVAFVQPVEKKASPAVIFMRSMTWPCWDLLIIPKFLYVWLVLSVLACRLSALSWVYFIWSINFFFGIGLKPVWRRLLSASFYFLLFNYSSLVFWANISAPFIPKFANGRW